MSNEQTDNRVNNVDSITDPEFKKFCTDRYDEIKKLQTEINEKEDKHNFINTVTKELSCIIDSTYANRFVLNTTIRYPSTFFTTPNDDILINLIRLQCHPNKSLYNTVLSSVVTNLSKNGRIGITRTYDALQSIELSYIDPTDIESVTLYVRVGLPTKYNSIQKLDWTRKLIDVETHVYSNDFYSQESCKHFYIPVKIITKFESNLVKFFETPILLCRAAYVSYSIEVKYTDNIKSSEHNFPVKLNYLLFEQEFRNKLVTDKKLGYRI